VNAALLVTAVQIAACGGEAPTDPNTNGGTGNGTSGNGSNNTNACAGPNSGTWNAVGVDGGLFLGEDCSFRFTGADGCMSTGTYAAPISDQGGTIQVSIESVSGLGGACLAAGLYSCAYLFQGDDFGLNCGGGVQLFSRSGDSGNGNNGPDAQCLDACEAVRRTNAERCNSTYMSCLTNANGFDDAANCYLTVNSCLGAENRRAAQCSETCNAPSRTALYLCLDDCGFDADQCVRQTSTIDEILQCDDLLLQCVDDCGAM